MTDTGWQHEVAALWERFDEYTEDEFLAAMERVGLVNPDCAVDLGFCGAPASGL